MHVDKIIKIFTNEGFKVVDLSNRYVEEQDCYLYCLGVQLSSRFRFYFTERGTGIKSVLKVCEKFKRLDQEISNDPFGIKRTNTLFTLIGRRII